MNDSSNGSVIVVLLFILRCLVPLAIMFGISYLLQRLGLVGYHTEEDEVQSQPPDNEKSAKQVVTPKRLSGQKEKNGKRKTGIPQKRSRTK
jgi:hypothetical protein